ncbi:hypothetical protein EGO51_19090 [Haloarcula hispanica]|uniref:Uncharacterized protein n=1 Tax=Haloarcula hispanica TaxID=51589 RepID=A0A5J5LFA5_HALHI|nr:hypothetical protein [Haloarcula hispanica]KAA9404605.1 hypothetical protein EGO51_19090 [Haloarcula hispanica]
MSSISHLTVGTESHSVDEVISALEAALTDADCDPDIYEHEGAVGVSRAFKPDDLSPAEVDRSVTTYFSDTVDAGSGELDRRVGDNFRTVDSVASPELGGDRYVIDYFRINYGITPRYGYQRTEPVGTRERVEADEQWGEIQSRTADWPVSPAQLNEWFDAYQPNLSDAEWADLLALLMTDSAFHVARKLLSNIKRQPPVAALKDLTAADPDTRTRAVRQVAAIGTANAEQYSQFIEALATVDRRTRALVAPTLWEPAPVEADGTPDKTLLTELLSLTDDDVPELRIGALAGASRLYAELQRAVEDGDLTAEEAADGVLVPLMDAYEEALTDRDVRVRERALAMATESLPDYRGYLLQDWDRLPFERRWEIGRTYAATAAEPESVMDSSGGILLKSAFDGEAEAVPTLVDYAYHERGPSYEAVRQKLKRLADDEPELAMPALSPAVDCVIEGIETRADVELIAELVSRDPERVVPAADPLAAMLDADGDGDSDSKRRAASRTLKSLPAEHVPVSPAMLTESTADVFNDWKLVADRVAALAEVDPDETVALLSDLGRQLASDEDPDASPRNIARALRAVAEVDPETVTQALPDLEPLFADAPQVTRHLAISSAAAATHDVESVAPYADEIGAWLASPTALVREAAATALVAIGETDPALLSQPYRQLLDRAEDALTAESLLTARNDPPAQTPPDWPAGVVAAADPDHMVEGVMDAVVDDRRLRGDVAGLVREIQAGNQETATLALESLLEDERLYSGAVSTLAEDALELFAGAADELTARLAREDERTDRETNYSFHPRKAARPYDEALAAAAAVDPEAVRSAIRSHYESVDAFASSIPTENRDAVEQRLNDSEPQEVRTEAGPSQSSETTNAQILEPQWRETNEDIVFPDPFTVLDCDEEILTDDEPILDDLAETDQEAADVLLEMEPSVQWRFARAYDIGAVDSDGLAVAVKRYDSLDPDVRNDFHATLARTRDSAIGFAGKVDEATFETIFSPRSRNVPSFGGTYGTDAVVPQEDVALEFSNEALTLERVYRDGSNNLRRLEDDSFVRRLLDSDGPVGELPEDADPDDERVSVLTKRPIPTAFVRMDDPDEETIVSKMLALDIDTNKVERLVELARATDSAVVSEDTLAAIQEVLDELDDLDDEDSIHQYIQTKVQ